MDLGGKAVLIVEDEPILRLMACDLAEDAGLHPIDCASAEEALKILEDGTVVVAVFTDIELLGEMDGLTMAFAIEDRWPPIAIIITSGAVSPVEMPGTAEFLPKPYNLQAVAATFSRLAA